MWWLAKRCLIKEQEHDWIIESMRWLGEQFGPEPARRPAAARIDPPLADDPGGRAMTCQDVG